MAEEGKENQNESSWWGSWINSAKTKTSTVFEAVKKDLDELSTAVKTEASNVGAAIENTLKFNEETSPVGNVKKSLSTFFGQVTEALIPSIEDDDNNVETVLITHDDLITLTGFQKHLADLQLTDKTYLNEPDKELLDKYKLWLEVIEQDQFTQDRLNKHLLNSEILNEKYLKFVPNNVTHMEFWQRYLFKRALLEDALANAEIAERRSKIEINSIKSLSPRKNLIQTEQPKLTLNENDKNDENNDNNKNKSDIKEQNEEQQKKQQKLNNPSSSSTLSSSSSDIENLENELMNDNNLNWNDEEIPNNVELSEEEQIRLLEQYEQEIQEREKKRNENNSNNKGKKTTNDNSKSKTSQKISKNDSKSSINQKQRQQSQKEKQQQQQQEQQQNISDNSTNLVIQKDHFNRDETTSSTSDESWEKDFDLND